MAEAQASRTVEFHQGLYESGFRDAFLSPTHLAEAESRARSRLDSPPAARPAPGGSVPVQRLGRLFCER